MRAAAWIAALCMAGGPAGGGDPPSHEDALRGIVEAYDGADWESAVSRADELLLRLEGSEVPERQVAEAHYARGVVLAGRAQAEPDSTDEGILAAAAPFESARALAGPGPLRLDATYDLGGVHLLEGERWRAQIPEVSGAQQPAQLPLPQAMGAAGPAEEPPDPLEKARASYLAAKACLIERLRADWHDVDTRADLELIQRRLKQLDEIERQREEQQQEQQQEDQQDQSGQQGEGENKPEDQEGDSQQQQDQSGEQKDTDQEGDSKKDQPQPGEQQDNQTQEVPRPEEGGEAQNAEDTSELSERHLTREEVMRLLDRLADVEQEGETLQEILRQARHVPVPRDW